MIDLSQCVTVGALKQYLADKPDETLVAVSRDSEGNKYQPASNEIGEDFWSDEEQDLISAPGPGLIPCITLYPLD